MNNAEQKQQSIDLFLSALPNDRKAIRAISGLSQRTVETLVKTLLENKTIGVKVGAVYRYRSVNADLLYLIEKDKPIRPHYLFNLFGN